MGRNAKEIFRGAHIGDYLGENVLDQ